MNVEATMNVEPGGQPHVPLVVVDQVTKRFGRQGEVLALDRVSFQVGAGEVFGLLGPNGAGKTTMLRLLVGLLSPDSGTCRVAGLDVQRQANEIKNRIGSVSANDGLYAWLTVREILHFFCDLYGVPPDVAQRRVANLAQVFGLESLLDRRSSTLSTGQKQRTVLARGLVHDPHIMLLDEPTRGLDVLGSQNVFDYIQHLKAAGKAVLLSTHRLDEAERCCDRFGLMHQGELRLLGSLGDLQAASGRDSLVELFADLAKEERDSDSRTKSDPT